MRRPTLPAPVVALICQLGGFALAVAALRAGLLPNGQWPLALLQATSAALLALALRTERWWVPIHLGFLPLALLTLQAGIAPAWFLGAFVLLALIYGSSYRTRVPLYLSNQVTVDAVARLLPPRAGLRVLDIGSGTGSLLTPLARRRPDIQLRGIESAPLPWLLAHWRSRRLCNLQYQRGDFFREPWGSYDCVYAFLSPVPMAQVWQKALAELPAGALLISNSFAVPGVDADETLELADPRHTRLYLYRMDRHRKPRRN